MAEKSTKKEVKKTTSKKPVEQHKTSKKNVKKSTKKTPEKKEVNVEAKSSKNHNVKEIKVEPKRSQKHEEKKVIEEQISNDMIEDDKDDKIWIVIALLLILLVGGAFFANKVVSTKKAEESSNNKILVSKTVFENEDGTIDVKVKVKSRIGLKTITLEDGTVMNFNNKKDVEVRFTAKENKEYTLIIKDKNGTKTRKKVKITQVKESMVEQKEDHELVVEEEVAQPNYVVYYYRPQKNNQITTTKVEEDAPQFDVEDNSYTNKKFINVKNSVKTTYIYNGEEPKIYKGEELTQDGTYEMTAINNSGKSTTVHFTIDTKAPVFVNLKDNETYIEMISAIATDDNLAGYVVNIDEYDENSDPVLTAGNYSVIAYDLAGNETKVNIKVDDLFNESNTINIYGQMVFNNQVTLNYNIKENLKLYKFDKDNNNYNEQTNFDFNNPIIEEGNYRLDIKINETTKYYYFVIDKTKPEIEITGKDENNDDIYESDDVKISDNSNIIDKQYGYNNDGKVETKPEATKPLPDNSEEMDKPKEDNSYLWVSATDIAGNTSVVVSDKPIQKEEQQIITNTESTEALINEN